MPSYNMIPTQELMKDGFYRRTYFCKQMMAMVDNNIIQHCLFSDECTFTLHSHANRQYRRY